MTRQAKVLLCRYAWYEADSFINPVGLNAASFFIKALEKVQPERIQELYEKVYPLYCSVVETVPNAHNALDLGNWGRCFFTHDVDGFTLELREGIRNWSSPLYPKNYWLHAAILRMLDMWNLWDQDFSDSFDKDNNTLPNIEVGKVPDPIKHLVYGNTSHVDAPFISKPPELSKYEFNFDPRKGELPLSDRLRGFWLGQSLGEYKKLLYDTIDSYIEQIEDELKRQGFQPTPAKQNFKHIEWAALYQACELSPDSISEQYEMMDVREVRKQIRRTLELAGLEPRKPKRGG